MRIPPLPTLLSTFILGLTSTTCLVGATSSPTGVPTASSSPSQSPTEFDCDGDRLTVDVFTGWFYFENYWILELKDDSTGEYITTANNDLPSKYTRYVDILCLEPGRSYRWTLFDTHGDGMFSVFQPDGTYSVVLNGEEIVSDGIFKFRVIKEIGPTECVDEPGIHTIRNPNTEALVDATCRAYKRQIRIYGGEVGETICGLTLPDGSGELWDKWKAECAVHGTDPCADL